MVGIRFDLVNATFGRRALVWAALLAAVAVALCFIPLFDVLGYDFAFALGVPTTFAAVDLGHGAAAAAHRRGDPRDARMFAASAGGALGLLAFPLLASVANALRVRNCNLGAGLVFFALLPASTALYGALAGALAGRLFPRRGRLVAWLVPIVSLLWALWRLYVDPPVFAFDPFGGYFPGPIYDEAMQPPARLVAYRAVNLLWIVTALALFAAGRAARAARTGGGSRRAWASGAIATALLVGSAIAFQQRGPLGFHVRKADLVAALPREIRTEHFVLHADPGLAETPRDLALVKDDLEFRYAQLTRVLGVEPAGPVTVYASRPPP